MRCDAMQVGRSEASDIRSLALGHVLLLLCVSVLGAIHDVLGDGVPHLPPLHLVSDRKCQSQDAVVGEHAVSKKQVHVTARQLSCRARKGATIVQPHHVDRCDARCGMSGQSLCHREVGDVAVAEVSTGLTLCRNRMREYPIFDSESDSESIACDHLPKKLSLWKQSLDVTNHSCQLLNFQV